MKKTFLKSIRLAGLMLLCGTAMVSCYESGDDVDYIVPTTPELPAAKYFIYCTVENADGSAINGAKVTIKQGSTVIKTETTVEGGISPVDVSATGAGNYSVTVEADGYITVNKPGTMMAVEKGSTSSLTFTVAMKKIEDRADFGVPDVSNEAASQEVQDAAKATVIDYLKNESSTPAAIKNAIANADNVKTSAITYDVVANGNTTKYHATKLVINVALDENSSRNINYVELGGYKITKQPSRTTPEEYWKEQANKYFGVSKDGFVIATPAYTLSTVSGMLLKGYTVTMAIVTNDLTFTAGETSENNKYTGTVVFQAGNTKIAEYYVNREPVKVESTKPDESTKNDTQNQIEENIKNLTIAGANVDTENIKTEETVIELNGQATNAFSVTIPFSIENTSDSKVEVNVPMHTGFTYSNLKKSSRATENEYKTEWVSQACAYLEVEDAGLKVNVQPMTIDNTPGLALKGYKVVEYYITKDLTFECGMDSELWTGTVVICTGMGKLIPIYANDNHDNHDNHDDHGGTSWGGGTSGH